MRCKSRSLCGMVPIAMSAICYLPDENNRICKQLLGRWECSFPLANNFPPAKGLFIINKKACKEKVNRKMKKIQGEFAKMKSRKSVKQTDHHKYVLISRLE